MKTRNIKDFFIRYRYTIIFWFSFFIYTTAGFWLNLNNDFLLNSRFDFLLNLDCGYKFKDSYARWYSHAVQILHPLILTIVDPFIKIIKLIIQNPKITMIFCQSLVGSLSNLLFCHCLTKLKIEGPIKYLLTAVFIFSFSNIIFSVFPEFYIYSGLVQVLLLLYAIICLNSNNKELSFTNIFTLALLSTFSFGINLANIIVALAVSLFVILQTDKTFKQKAKNIAKYLLILLALITSVTIVQKYTRLGTTTFIRPFIQRIKYGNPISQTYFFNKLPHGERIKYIFKGVFTEPLYSLKISPSYVNSVLNFEKSQNPFVYLPVLIFFILPIIYAGRNFGTLKNRKFIALLLLIVLINAAESYVWEVDGCFLFSQNNLAYLLLLISLLYENVPKKSAITACSLFVLWQIYANVTELYGIEQFVSLPSEIHHNVLYYIPYSLLMLVLFFIPVFGIKKLTEKLSHTKVATPLSVFRTLDLSENKFEFYLSLYFRFILIFSFVWFLYVRGFLCLRMF